MVKLPIRHPVLVAKQVTSTAVLTNNRLLLGVGTSPWPEDYVVCDVPWSGRGRRLDEQLDIIRGLGTGDYFEYHGSVFDLPAVKMSPAPSPAGAPVDRRSPRGGTEAGRGEGRRVAARGGDPADLPGLLARLRELREEHGTADRPFEVHVISLDAYSVDGVRRLEEQGVTDVIVGFRWPYVTEQDTETLDVKLDVLRRFADDVIAKVKD